MLEHIENLKNPSFKSFSNSMSNMNKTKFMPVYWSLMNILGSII